MRGLAITFSSKELEKKCLDEKYQKRKLDAKLAKKLRLRLGELRTADTVSELWGMPGDWHSLSAKLKGKVAASLTANYRLIIEGTDTHGQEHQWEKCTSVRIVDIDDYHNKK